MLKIDSTKSLSGYKVVITKSYRLFNVSLYKSSLFMMRKMRIVLCFCECFLEVLSACFPYTLSYYHQCKQKKVKRYLVVWWLLNLLYIVV